MSTTQSCQNANWHVLFSRWKVSWGNADTNEALGSVRTVIPTCTNKRTRKKALCRQIRIILFCHLASLHYFPTMIRREGKEEGHVGGGLQVSRPNLEEIPSNESSEKIQTNVPNQLDLSVLFFFCFSTRLLFLSRRSLLGAQANNHLWSWVNNTLKQWHQNTKTPRWLKLRRYCFEFLQKGIREQEFLDESLVLGEQDQRIFFFLKAWEIPGQKCFQSGSGTDTRCVPF